MRLNLIVYFVLMHFVLLLICVLVGWFLLCRVSQMVACKACCRPEVTLLLEMHFSEMSGISWLCKYMIKKGFLRATRDSVLSDTESRVLTATFSCDLECRFRTFYSWVGQPKILGYEHRAYGKLEVSQRLIRYISRKEAVKVRAPYGSNLIWRVEVLLRLHRRKMRRCFFLRCAFFLCFHIRHY